MDLLLKYGADSTNGNPQGKSIRQILKESLASKIFTFVEEMPMFPGCEEIALYSDRKTCADKVMLTFIYKNIEL